MAHIVVLGASHLQKPLIELCVKLHGRCSVISNEANPDLPVGASYYNCDLRKFERLWQLCKEINPDGIATIASDLTALSASYVCSRLNLPTEPFEKISKICNKAECKRLINKSTLGLTASELTSREARLSIKNGHPVVIKPSDRSGSRGVNIVRSLRDFNSAIDEAKANSFNGKILIEEFLDGPEYSVESISIGGQHFVLSITKKFLFPGTPVEQAHVNGPVLEENMVTSVCKFTEKLLQACDLVNCASHTEIKLTDNGVKLIEIGPRIGGDFIGSHLVPVSSGVNYCEKLLESCIGGIPSLPENLNPQSNIYNGIMFSMDSRQEMKQLETLKNFNCDIIDRIQLNNEGSKKIKSSADRFSCLLWQSRSKELHLNSLINNSN